MFGEVAERYHLRRPSYPDEVVDRIASLAGAGGRVVEAGAGTGKLTAALVDRGLAVTALEPSLEMAAVLRRTCPGADVVEVGFEDWDGPAGEADLVAAGQSWHWVDHDRRVDLAARTLRAGGVVALVWNREGHLGPVGDAIAAAYRRWAPDLAAVGSEPDAGLRESEQSALDGLDTDDRFAEADVAEVRWTLVRERDEYLELLTTHSNHRLVEPAAHDRLLGAIGEAIDDHGGRIELDVRTTLITARRR